MTGFVELLERMRNNPEALNMLMGFPKANKRVIEALMNSMKNKPKSMNWQQDLGNETFGQLLNRKPGTSTVYVAPDFQPIAPVYGGR